MNTEMQIIREVNSQAENFYDAAVMLGDHAAFALGRSHRSQMTGLENIADGALKTSDIFDYIKRQTARFPYWRQNFLRDKEKDATASTGFGERLLHYLQQRLKQQSEGIYNNQFKRNEEAAEDQHLKRRIYLLLIRQFVHQMVAQYEFRVNVGNNNASNSKKGAQ